MLPISVVIPAYDAAETLGATIASVLAQTDSPAEIIVVDDGSGDATADVARAYGVRLISRENGGLSTARNLGIEAATQPWIALLDADDRWSPGKLALQWRALAATGDEICATDLAYMRPDGSRVTHGATTNRGFRRLDVQGSDGSVVHLARSPLVEALAIGMFLQPSTLLFRRSIVIERGQRFLERSPAMSSALHHVGEDFEWFLRVLRFCDVTFVRESLVDYAIGDGRLSSNAGRMRYGDVKLGDLVCAAPHRYADGAPEAMLAVRAPRLREATREYLRRFEFDAAAYVAREALAERKAPLEFSLWAAAASLHRVGARGPAMLARDAYRSMRRRSSASIAQRSVPSRRPFARACAIISRMRG